jgi:hypothetical protein
MALDSTTTQRRGLRDRPEAARLLAERLNRFVRGVGEDPSAEAALSDFRRFPVETYPYGV